MTVICCVEQDESDVVGYHAGLDTRLRGDFQFDLNRGDGDMFYAKHHSDNFTIIDCRLPDLRKSLTVIGSSMI
jgi:hypothetical protein